MDLEGRLNLVLDAVEEPIVPLQATQGVDGLENLIGSRVSRRAMNSTAYRIFKLLQWLIETPLSVDALNRKFCADPRIGRPVSSDSIWLYVNTLKTLGCRIRRPSPRNGFQYEMLGHPFGLMLSSVHLETLAQAKAVAQQKFDHQEMRVLDGLLKKIMTYSDCNDPQQRIEQLFAQSRSYDYADCEKHIAALETCITQGMLLKLVYLSPLKGKERFCFLPQSLYYEQGVLYVRGEHPEREAPSSLRVDRILELKAIGDEVLSAALKDRENHKTEVLLHMMVDECERFDGLKLGENQGVYQERVVWLEHAARYEVTLQVRDFFYLKQRLLACGLPFRIVEPAAFKEDMTQTLRAMLQFYQDNGEVAAHGDH